MRVNTMVTLGASAAFGIMAVFLARGWINNAVENEFRQIKKPSTQDISTNIKTAPVLIADIKLNFGDTLSPENIRIANYPEDAVPEGAFTSIEALFEDLGEIRPGFRAFTIRVDDVSGVAGFVVPGDVVDVIYTREPEIAATQRLQVPGAASAYISDVILQNLNVLAVDQNQSEKTSAANVARTVTLEVTNEDAQALKLAMEYGTLSLSLRSIGETTPTIVSQLKLSDLNPSISVVPKRLKKGSKKKNSVAEKPSNMAQVTVIRGRNGDEDSVESLSVMREQRKSEVEEEKKSILLSQLAGGLSQ